ncbi:MAG: hypothetical protein ACR2GU_04375 [Rubrobacteraceae bacterium]
MQQISNTFRFRGAGLRGPWVAGVLALVCWVAAVVVFATLPSGSGARFGFALAVSWAAAFFAAGALIIAFRESVGEGRVFWALLGGGMALRFAGDVFWNYYEMFGANLKTPLLAPQDFAYAISYLLILGALLWLVRLTTWRITSVSALDALAIMLSTAALVWYFVLGPGAAAAGLENGRAALVALWGPVCDAALLFLGLVVLSTARRPPLANLLIPGFLAFLVADALYLGIRAQGPYGSGNWSDMFWALGVVLVGLSALCKPPARVSTGLVEPWRILLFWFGPPLTPAALHPDAGLGSFPPAVALLRNRGGGCYLPLHGGAGTPRFLRLRQHQHRAEANSPDARKKSAPLRAARQGKGRRPRSLSGALVRAEGRAEQRQRGAAGGARPGVHDLAGGRILHLSFL